jgi:hypothetical protein
VWVLAWSLRAAHKLEEVWIKGRRVHFLHPYNIITSAGKIGREDKRGGSSLPG